MRHLSVCCFLYIARYVLSRRSARHAPVDASYTPLTYLLHASSCIYRFLYIAMYVLARLAALATRRYLFLYIATYRYECGLVLSTGFYMCSLSTYRCPRRRVLLLYRMYVSSLIIVNTCPRSIYLECRF